MSDPSTDKTKPPMGYHLSSITKGVYGEASKIFEETEEFRDAIAQGNKIMSLVELADMVGAMDAYLQKEYDGKIGMHDLLEMSAATRRAFATGDRK